MDFILIPLSCLFQVLGKPNSFIPGQGTFSDPAAEDSTKMKFLKLEGEKGKTRNYKFPKNQFAEFD
jgi:hypothetical protein